MASPHSGRWAPDDHPLQGITDRPRSAALCNVASTRNGECEANALRALPHAPRGTRLVRGWANLFTDERRWHKHAWLETRAGGILEVTPRYLQSAGRVRYRPVQRLNRVEVRKLLAIRRALGDVESG